VSDAPWLDRPPPRRITLADVRERCRALPSPGRTIHAVVDRPRAAALVVPVVDVGGEAAVVTTKRPPTMEHHRDDWVFPGGRVDPDRDASPIDAALRELHEELGVERDHVEIVGQLATHGPIRTGYVIDVFVAILDGAGRIAPNRNEVAEVAIVPISVLAGEGSYHTAPDVPEHDPGPTAAGLVRFDEDEIVVRHFAVRAGEHLWGTQANILHELLTHLFASPPVA
jgi:8-oxo-dGTP pyrophosphatase MutT (NUDIX family)